MPIRQVQSTAESRRASRRKRLARWIAGDRSLETSDPKSASDVVEAMDRLAVATAFMLSEFESMGIAPSATRRLAAVSEALDEVCLVWMDLGLEAAGVALGEPPTDLDPDEASS